MKKGHRAGKRLFHSIYFRFAVVFLGVWWLLNTLALGVVFRVLTSQQLLERLPVDRPLFSKGELHPRGLIALCFLSIACLGTILILLVVRRTVQPIRLLSGAANRVAKGDFDVSVRVRGRDELAQLTQDFNAMVRDLGSMDTLRRDFVSDVSHEFRTPATSIRGFATLLRDEELDPAQRRDYCDIIAVESDRLIRLSSNLLRLSELDSRGIRDAYTVYALDEQIRKVILSIEPVWSKKDIRFELDLPPLQHAGPRDLLWQVWLNLIQNAIQFSPAGGLVEVSLESLPAGRVRVRVRDEGVGIAPEDLSRIFDRFYQADRARNSTGSGLGLVIARRIVELAGGTITVESEVSSGTAFTVELPADTTV